jgi:flagellar hook protein FlgE
LWREDGILRTVLASKTLETSNVDLTVGLTELIALQRAYGANSKAVTTSDELEQGAINLKK